LFLTETPITILHKEYLVKKVYIKDNRIYLNLYNKKNKQIKVFSVDKFTDENSIKKPHFLSLFYARIKFVILKYIKHK